jgi:beta-glucanase (GH16 family)
MMKNIILFLSGIVLLISLFGCKSTVEPNCFEGYHAEDGQCVEDDPICFAPSDYPENLTYELVFSDEFDGNTLDESVWNLELFGGGGNNENVLYTENNHIVSDGYLTITAKHEQVNDWDYTSSRLTTKNHQYWKYGKVEIRAQIPDGLGTWPAIWMLPEQNAYGIWPNSGEIDIMEHVGYDLNKIFGTIHTRLYNHKYGSQKGGFIDDFDDVTTVFHTYSIEWLPDKIVFYMDDIVYYTYNPNKYSTCPNYKVWPFNKDFYLIINLAVGGDWGGAQGVNPDDYPTSLIIDYVRVYQAKELVDFDDYSQ